MMIVRNKTRTLQWVYGTVAVLYAIVFLADLISLDGTLGNGTYIDLLTRLIPALVICAFFCFRTNGISFFFALVLAVFVIGSGLTCVLYHAEMLGTRDIWFGVIYLVVGVSMSIATFLLYLQVRKNCKIPPKIK